MAAPSHLARRPWALVHGGGPTGALAALALADAGWRVLIRDPLTPQQLLERERAYAFNHASQRFLQQLGLWSALAPTMAPFRQLQLRDCALQQQVPFDPTDLPGRCRLAQPAVGWIGRHRPLMTVLLQRLQAEAAIELQFGGSEALPPPDGAPDLELAADGPASPRRRALGIGCWRLPYRQQCLTAQVELRGNADDQAWELFRPEGPFAVLPLGDRQAQLVWSAPAERCRRLEALAPAPFLEAVAAALPESLEPDALLDRPRAFPVELLLARRLSRGRTVLVGESGHRCHPVGGQGLNLCWRDVAVLHRLARRAAAGQLPLRRLPAAYGRRRWLDVVFTLAFTHALVLLFSNRQRLLLPLRRLLLLLLGRLAPLRRLSLGLMTLGIGG
jgi:2-octaprenyl-6-methoxyphenol hydroxylase